MSANCLWRNDNSIRFGYFALCSLLFALPLLSALWYAADFVYLANESLAYRYFLAGRLLDHEPAWIWNGHLTTVIQKPIYYLIDKWYPVDALRTRTQVFSFATLGLYALLMAVLFAIAAKSKDIDWTDRALLAVSALCPLYATKTAGFYYFLLPDYYALNVVFGATTVFLFQRAWRRSMPQATHFRGFLLGAYSGIIAANKIYMTVLGAIPLVPYLLSYQANPLKEAARIASIAAGWLLALLVVMLAFYSFDVTPVKRLLPTWWAALLLMTGESAFQGANWFAIWTHYSYGLILALWMLVISVAIVHAYVKRSATGAAMVVCNAVVGAVVAFVLIKRPAGTTAFEAATLLIVCICVTLSSFPRGRQQVLFCTAVVAASLLYSTATFAWRHNIEVVSNASTRGQERWNFYKRVMRTADGVSTLVIFPNNEYHHEGVHEFLLKGSAEFPTWTIAAQGQKLIDRYAPGLSFRHEYGGPHPSLPIPDGVVVVWFDLPNNPALVDKYPSLKEAVKRVDASCFVQDFKKQRQLQVVAHACALPRTPK